MKRNEVLQFRVTADEKAEIEKLGGKNVSEFIRSRVLPESPAETGRVMEEAFKEVGTSTVEEAIYVESPKLQNGVEEDTEAFTKLVKKLEARPNVTPEQALERALAISSASKRI